MIYLLFFSRGGIYVISRLRMIKIKNIVTRIVEFIDF